MRVQREDTLKYAKAFINDGLRSGALDPIISRIFRFDQVQEATRFLESNQQIGKIVLSV